MNDDDDDDDDVNYFNVKTHALGKQIMSKTHEHIIYIFIASHITQLHKARIWTLTGLKGIPEIEYTNFKNLNN